MYYTRTAPMQGMGFWPLLGGMFAGGALAFGSGSDCTSWWCLENLKRSLFSAPEQPPKPTFPAPAAPTTSQVKSYVDPYEPKGFNPDTMLERTRETGTAFRSGAAYTGQAARQVYGDGVNPPTGDPALPLVALGLVGVGVLLAIR